MPLTFSPMTNHETFPITTANNNTLVTLNSPATFTATAIFSASVIVSMNFASAIPVAATGQDANFETMLWKMSFSN